MNSFDHLKTTLDGRKLIESSAGTGKTYAIASLYVRLLLERALQVHQILVVTFTEAATAELRNRIRLKIRAALQAFENGPPESEEFLTSLVDSAPDRIRAQASLREALYSFDEAAIFTIHGFCQKALQENAFESSCPFNTELIVDQSTICQQIVDDFWRNHFYAASPVLARHALEKEFGDSLLELLNNTISSPKLKLIPEGLSLDSHELESREAEAKNSFASAANLWSAHSDAVRQLLLEHKGLNKNQYKMSTIPIWFDELDFYLASHLPLPQPKWLTKLCPSTLQNGTNKGFQAPRHPFFDACERLRQSLGLLESALDHRLLALKTTFVQNAPQELRRRKRLRNVRSFDDLLRDLHTALRGPGGDVLAAALRSRFKAALIDEFQDTDPIQYEIFNAIFVDHSSLFLIGDPKQAIYSFRGADIFAYMKAAEEVRDQYTLSKNWRSVPRLITAVNTLFLRQCAPFVFPEIRYFKAEPAESESEFAWGLSPDRSPLKIWFLARQAGSVNPMSKAEAEETIPEAVAGEIVQLLNAGRRGEALIKGRGVSPWDIAVLVRTNEQAHTIQRALRNRRIPSVTYGTGSVFQTAEARELHCVLSAVADPGNEAAVKAALVTDLIGLRGDDLARLAESDTAWDAHLNNFADYRDLWIEKGFITMIRTWLTKERVRTRLLAYGDGERRLTNLLHCIELLQEAALQERLGVEGILKYSAVRMRQNDAKAEEQQIRLETDEKALKVITIHRSKGLEFPIVFCPYIWDARDTKTDQATFHDTEDRTVLIKDLGSEHLAGNRIREQMEALSEDCRLLYVALTRAKYRCTVCWGAIKGSARSAPAYLFHLPSGAGSVDLPAAVRQHYENLTDEQILTQLRKLARESGHALQVVDIPEPSDDTYEPFVAKSGSYRARLFSGRIPADWGSASFTRFTSGEARGVETRDHDAIGSAAAGPRALEKVPAVGKTILEFPKGSRPGTFLHRIFEELDFATADDSNVRELVRKNLDLFGFDAAWEAAVCQTIRNALSIPLACEGEEILLGRVSAAQRLSEMDFGFPLDRITSAELAYVFEQHVSAAVPRSFTRLLRRLDFKPIGGLMKGFIDLVFQWSGRYYLLDWKSNYLGPQLEDYGQASMQRAMERDYYLLQYHLYTVALHKYLAFRTAGYEYEKHFGGVFYLFLRGIDPAQGPKFGVYADRPSKALIEDLSARLGPGGRLG